MMVTSATQYNICQITFPGYLSLSVYFVCDVFFCDSLPSPHSAGVNISIV